MRVLITGASSGIGLELARLFKDEELIVVSSNSKKLAPVSKELSARAIVIDLSKTGSAQKLYDKVGEVDILINNAGFGDLGEFMRMDKEKLSQMLQLNMITLTELTRLYLPEMVRKRKGRIMNVASTAAFLPGPYMSTYFATKAYVLMLTEGIAEEIKGSGVTITALCPGATASGFQEKAGMKGVSYADHRKIPSSAEVARFGYEKMMRGDVIAVHGLQNKFFTFLVRILPRSTIRKVVKNLQSKRI